MRRRLWMLLALLACVSGEYLMGGHLDNNAGSKTGKIESSSILGRKTRLDDLDLVAMESTVAAGVETGDEDVPRYHIPYPFAFNGGKPFSLEKDPITGKIDFEKAPPVKALNYTGHYHEREDKENEQNTRQEKNKDKNGSNEIITSNFHDFLNVHYSSDKYGKYPLISSSYANTKVQSGANSYSTTYNHRHHSESELYVRPIKNYPPTSTYKTTTTVNDLKVKWTSITNPTTTFVPPITINSVTSTKVPIVTTWKPSNLITFHSIDHAEAENEKNFLPIEKLHASSQMGSHRNLSDVSTQSPSDEITTSITRYKNQSNLDNFVKSETKPQNEEYKESYDTYESNGESDDNSEDNYYILSFGDLLKEDVTSSTISSTTIASTTTTASSTETTTSITTVPSRPSTLPVLQKDVPANKPLQFPTISQHSIIPSSFNNRYRPITKLDRIEAGVIESTSNIVIPPNQDTVSFVLGNHQNVDGNGYYSIGTGVRENPYGSSSNALYRPLRNDPHNPTGLKEIKHEHWSITESNPDHVTQKWWSSTPLKDSNNLTRPPLITPTDTKNVSKDSSYIIFPNNETKNKDVLKEEHIVIINEADGSELPSKTMLSSTNKTKFDFPANGDLPQLAEDLVPPAESSKSPSNYYHFDSSKPNQARPQRLPPHIKQHHGLLDVGVRKRPYSTSDMKLPNILPQFRPNAKASHGHRSPDVIGTMPAGQNVPTRIRQPTHSSRRQPPPSYLQRLNPPPPPIHMIRLAFTPISKVDLSHETEPTIRKLRPPPSRISSLLREDSEENTSLNRLFVHGDSSDGEDGESRNADRDKSEITDKRSERYPEEPPMTPPKPPLFPKRRTAEPPRVATLQMIQHHGEFGNEAQLAQSVEPMLEAERRKSEISEQPVYVVYPVNTAVNIHPDDSNEKDGSVVVGTRGPHRPLPPDDLLQNEEDNTYTVYNGKPVALDFPYPLELPDPSSIFPVGVKETPVLIPSEQRQQQQISAMNEREKNDAANVIPYLQDFLPYRKKNDAAISVTLHRTPTSSPSLISTMSTSPIAYVYTPTHAPTHLNENLDNDNNDKQTVLLPSQQPSSSSSSAPAPQNFMAPFVASMSAETPSKNGWSVVEPPAEAERKSDSDSDEAKPADSENDTQTERNEFDADNFKPQLFGGFKPLYEFPTEDDVAAIDTEINIHTEELLPDKR